MLLFRRILAYARLKLTSTRLISQNSSGLCGSGSAWRGRKSARSGFDHRIRAIQTARHYAPVTVTMPSSARNLRRIRKGLCDISVGRIQSHLVCNIYQKKQQQLNQRHVESVKIFEAYIGTRHIRLLRCMVNLRGDREVPSLEFLVRFKLKETEAWTRRLALSLSKMRANTDGESKLGMQ